MKLIAALLDSLASQYIDGKPIFSDVSNTTVIKGPKKLLDECFQLHDKCPKARSRGTFRPTRLIDVGIIGGNDIP